jgi:hypothetical protein
MTTFNEDETKQYKLTIHWDDTNNSIVDGGLVAATDNPNKRRKISKPFDSTTWQPRSLREGMRSQSPSPSRQELKQTGQI